MLISDKSTKSISSLHAYIFQIYSNSEESTCIYKNKVFFTKYFHNQHFKMISKPRKLRVDDYKVSSGNP